MARRTRDVATLCDAAGYGVILIETIGVGQSETMVADMTDLFLLLMAPAGGDELQGVKRGIMEIADMILVNKADGDLKVVATRTCADYAGALRLLRKRPQDPDEFPKAMMVSSLQESGLDQVWSELTTLLDWRKTRGYFSTTRVAQQTKWFQEEVESGLLAKLKADPKVRNAFESLANDVAAGRILPRAAADQVLLGFAGGIGDKNPQ